MPRGIRVWDGRDLSPDLFGLEPAPAPPPVAKPASGPKWRRYTDRENRRLEKVLPVFVAWLHGAKIEALEKARTADLMKRFPPMQRLDIEQMISVALNNLQRKAKR